MRMKRIAVVIELEWPVNRHHQVYAGIQSYATTKSDWALFPDRFPETVLAGTWPGKHYDALIGRAAATIGDRFRIGLLVGERGHGRTSCS